MTSTMTHLQWLIYNDTSGQILLGCHMHDMTCTTNHTHISFAITMNHFKHSKPTQTTHILMRVCRTNHSWNGIILAYHKNCIVITPTPHIASTSWHCGNIANILLSNSCDNSTEHHPQTMPISLWFMVLSWELLFAVTVSRDRIWM